LVTEHEPIGESSTRHRCQLDVVELRRCASADPAAYDGTHVGVSATLLNPGTRETRSCGPLKALPTLTIMGSVVHIDWGTGPFNGPISPQGRIALKNDYQSWLNAQIDAQGNVKGTIGAQCTYDSVWRKR
jgi:hypothetical protein